MQYVGSDSTVKREGKVESEQGHAVLAVENPEGRVVLLIATGKVVPDNWVGERVRITVEKL